MSLSSARLQSALATDFLTQLQTQFPINASLLPAEKTSLAAAQTNCANAMAAATAPDVVTEVQNATINPGTFTNGAGGLSGTGTLA